MPVRTSWSQIGGERRIEFRIGGNLDNCREWHQRSVRSTEATRVKVRAAACRSCGSDWSAGDFNEACAECAGGALDRPCPVCGGRCGARWERALFDSNDSGQGHWFGRCNLPRSEQEARRRFLSRGMQRTARHWIEKAYVLLQQDISDGDVAARLETTGCPPQLAEKLVAFLPLACGRLLLAGSGVVLSRSFRPMNRDGSVGGPRKLESDPCWLEIEAFLPRGSTVMREAIGIVGRRSAELDAANKAAARGSRLADLVGAEPIFLFVEPVEDPPRQISPWWAFWRR